MAQAVWSARLSPSASAQHVVLGERFALLRRLGAGSFGVVYEALDLRDGGRVAVKVLRRAEGDWLYRFKREFRSLQGLAHPHLVALDELVSDEDQWFFSMELVDGVNFLEHVRDSGTHAVAAPELESATLARGTSEVALSSASPEWAAGSALELGERELRSSLAQLFEGLAALHGAGKVHRDIKPSNVLVTRDGRVVLIDFGLIGEAFLTSTESVAFGTAAYMAPEQASASRLGPLADVYAVGVMLYEALTGQLPFSGSPLQVLLAKQQSEPAPPSSIVSSVPSDLNALCMALLRREPGSRPTARECADALRAPTNVRPSTFRTRGSTPFVGRVAELASLGAAFERTRQGQTEVVLISGESGIGKTQLCQRFRSALAAQHPEVLVLEGRCYERETIPYKALDGIVDALSAWFSSVPVAQSAELLPAQRSMLGRLFPVFLRLPEFAKQQAPAEAAGGSPQEQRLRAFLELRELFVRVSARHPTLIVLDDLQWADDDGLRGLAELLRAPGAPALLFVATLRTGASAAEGARERLLQFLPPAQLFELTSLDSDDTEALVRLLAGDGAAGAARWIVTESRGHPLFVEELAQQLAGDAARLIPCSLDDVIWRRVLELALPQRQLLELIVVAGKPAPKAVASVAAALPAGEFQRALAALYAARLIGAAATRGADALDTYHDRVRESVLAHLSAERRTELHRALAHAFEAQADSDHEALAMHFRAAGDDARAANYATSLADQALHAFAFERAAGWLEHALSLLPAEDPRHRSLLVKLGDALSYAGRGAQASLQFEAAARLSSRVEALDLRSRAADQLLRSGHFDRGLEAARRVMSTIGLDIPGSRLHTLIAFVFYGVCLHLRGYRFRVRTPEQIGPEALLRIDACSAMAMVSFTDPLVGFLFARRSLLLALAAGDLARLARTLAVHFAMVAAFRAKSVEQIDEYMSWCATLADQSGSVTARAYVAGPAGTALFFSGHFQECLPQLTLLLRLSEAGALGMAFERTTAQYLAMTALAFLGRFDELCQMQEAGLRDASLRRDVHAEVMMRVGAPNLAWLIRDQPEQAERELQAALETWTTQGFHTVHFYAFSARVLVQLYTGQIEAAYELTLVLLQRCRRSLLWRVQNVRVRVLHLRGAASLAMLRQGLGDPQRLLREVQRSARAIQAERVAWGQPFAKVLLAGISSRRGDRTRAIRQLVTAAGDFDARGMSAFACAALDRAARLRADDDTARQIEKTRAALTARGVQNVERLLCALMPESG